MNRLLVLLPTILLLSGCGGSGSAHSSSAGRPAHAASTAGAPGGSASAGSGTAGSSRGAPGPPPGGGAGAVPPAGGSDAGSINARVPADFHLTLDGRLLPGTISIPAFLAVALSVSSADVRPHTLLVRTPSPHTLSLAPHGHASLRIAGLKAGSYAVQVDGRARATLVIGGEPGP